MTYVPAFGPAGALRLHLNENTAGCSPAVLAALRTIERTETAFYPDYAPITRACETWFGVPAGWVQLTNGLDEGLHVAALTARLHLDERGAGDPHAVIVVDPAFEMYDACAEAVGLRTTHIAPLPGFAFPEDGIRRAVTASTRLVYLTDPNNPTGLAIPAGAIARLAEAAPHATVFVDEAYAEFSGRTFIPALARHANVIVGRTFAKAHGLAALRVGALIAPPETLAPLRRSLPPYSLNICAVRALTAALDDRAYLDASVAQAQASKALIYDWCDALGLPYWRSEGNFVLIRVGAGAARLVRDMAERGVLIRDRSSQPGCDGCVRVTAGEVEATRRCLGLMEELRASRPD